MNAASSNTALCDAGGEKGDVTDGTVCNAIGVWGPIYNDPGEGGDIYESTSKKDVACDAPNGSVLEDVSMNWGMKNETRNMIV